MTARRHLPSELIIGVVGPYDLVERIMLSGAAARDETVGAGPPGTPAGPAGGLGLVRPTVARTATASRIPRTAVAVSTAA